MPEYILLPDRNLPLALPGGTLLISYTEQVITLHWFKGTMKTEPIRRMVISTDEWRGIFTAHGWNFLLVMELVLTIKDEG